MLVPIFDREEPEKVRQNVGMIDDMVDRLGRHLDPFAQFRRRSGRKDRPGAAQSRHRHGTCHRGAEVCGASGLSADPRRYRNGYLGAGRTGSLATGVGQPAQQWRSTRNAGPDRSEGRTCLWKMDGPRVHVRVRGTGRTGMTEDAEIAPNCSIRSSPPREPGQGHGLGLSISYNIVGADFWRHARGTQTIPTGVRCFQV